MTSTDWHFCRHCLDLLSNHADNKCLYDSTYFRQVSCIACESEVTSVLSTAVIGGSRYFMCIVCANTPIFMFRETLHITVKQYRHHHMHIKTWLGEPW